MSDSRFDIKKRKIQGVSYGLWVTAFSVFCFLKTGFTSSILMGEVSAGLGTRLAVPQNTPSVDILPTTRLRLSLLSEVETSESMTPPDTEPAPAPATALSTPNALAIVSEDLTEVPLSVQPRLKTLSEEDADRLKSEYLFAQGRVLQASGDNVAAIRKYQRAYRYSQGAEMILCNVVQLAADLERPDELLTYFRKIKNLGKMDVLALRDVGIQLTIQDAWDEAALAFQAAAESSSVKGNPAAMVFLRQDLARTHYVRGDYEQAAQNFRYVHRAMQRPERYDLDEEMTDALMSDAAFYYSLMADTYLLNGNVELAEAILQEAIHAQHEELSHTRMSKRQRETQQTVILATAGFTRAKIAFLQKRYGDAKILLELVLPKVSPEAELGEAPYKWYADTLSALDQTDLILPELTKYYNRNTANATLGFFLAGKFLQAARNEKNTEKSLDFLRRAEVILKKHIPSRPTTAHLADLLENSIRRGNAGHLWESLDYVFSALDSEQDLRSVLELASTRMAGQLTEASLDSEDESAALNSDEPAGEAKTDFPEKLDGKSTGPDDIPFTPDSLTFYPLLVDAAAAGEKSVRNAASRSAWKKRWLLGILAKFTENPTLAEEHFQTVEDILAKQKSREEALPFLITRGFSFIDAQQYDRAATCFQTALQLAEKSPTRQRVLFYLTSLFLMDKQYDQALRQAEVLVKESPKSLTGLLLQAQVTCAAGRHEDAKMMYEHLLETAEADPKNASREVVREAGLSLAALYSHLNRHTDAENLLESILDEFPDDTGAKNDLAYLWSQNGVHLRRAKKMALACVAEEPENASYLDTLGWVLFRGGEHEKALETLHAANVRGDDPVVMSHLGDVLAALGRPEEAVTWWQDSLKQFAQSREKGGFVADEDEAHVRRQLEYADK